MSRIFLWNELVDRAIPTSDDFAAVRVRVTRILTDAPEVYGGVLFGSVLTGQSGPLSDLDILVMFTGESPEKSMALRSVFHDLAFFAHENHVPLNLIPVELGAVKDGAEPTPTKRHCIHAGLYHCLAAASVRGGIIKENPVPLLEVPLHAGAHLREAREYVSRTNDKLMKGLLGLPGLSEADRCRLYANALDKPIHALRRALETRMDPKEVAALDSKSALREEGRKIFGSGVGVPLDALRDRAEGYRDILMLAQELLLPKKKHDDFLSTLGHALEEALSVMHALRAQL